MRSLEATGSWTVQHLRQLWNDRDRNRFDDDGQRRALKLIKERWVPKWAVEAAR